MAYPIVSIAWINYNSMQIMDSVLMSLENVSQLNYPADRYELIVVDNGSTDGSFEKIKKFLEKRNIRKKIIRLRDNFGFSGGINAAWLSMDRDAKYFAWLNNDAIPLPNSLGDLIEYAETVDSIGAIQGIILRDENTIDTIGNFITENLTVVPICGGKTINSNEVPRRPFYITYTDGSYALYNVNALKKVAYSNIMLLPQTFGYLDDNLLGLLLWNHGYRIISIPQPVAFHKRGATFKEIAKLYSLRGRITLILSTTTRYKKTLLLENMLKLPMPSLQQLKKFKIFSMTTVKTKLKLFNEAKAIARKLVKRYGLIDIYKAPIIELDVKNSFYRLFMPGSIANKIVEKRIKNLVNFLSI
ncbi:MAG: glycosyltransferase [Nitrososphaerota archaeon]